MSKLELTDFQILQLAATLAVSPDNSPKKAEQKRQREIMNNFQIGVTG